MISRLKLIPSCALIVFLWITATSAFAADYFASVAYQNPLPTQMGVNFKAQWNRVAAEIGLGYQGKTEKNKLSDEMRFRYGLTGDINVKYYWFDEWFRPYVEGGVIVHPTSRFTSQRFSIGSKTSSGFVSGGIWLGGQQLFCYMAASYLEGSPKAQFGVGTAIY